MTVTLRFFSLRPFRVRTITGHYPRLEIRDNETHETIRFRPFDPDNYDPKEILEINPAKFQLQPGQHFAFVDMYVEFVTGNKFR